MDLIPNKLGVLRIKEVRLQLYKTLVSPRVECSSGSFQLQEA